MSIRAGRNQFILPNRSRSQRVRRVSVGNCRSAVIFRILCFAASVALLTALIGNVAVVAFSVASMSSPATKSGGNGPSESPVILVIGSCGLDRLLTVSSYPVADSKIRTTSYAEVGGGNAANTASGTFFLVHGNSTWL